MQNEQKASSFMKRWAYNAAKKTLTVEMITSNRLYVYQDVPQEVYDGLAAAESAGRYYGQNIKNKFACLIEEPFLEDGPPAA
jgi:hypothetical protein